MHIKRRFAEEVKNRKAEREHTLSLTQSQRYILRELRELFRQVTDEDERVQITVLEKAFRGTITTAINRELNLLRKNHVVQYDLLKSLGQIYFQHDMQHWNGSQQRMEEDDEVKLICSEAFLS